jgi:hypothetical protein
MSSTQLPPISYRYSFQGVKWSTLELYHLFLIHTSVKECVETYFDFVMAFQLTHFIRIKLI